MAGPFDYLADKAVEPLTKKGSSSASGGSGTVNKPGSTNKPGYTNNNSNNTTSTTTSPGCVDPTKEDPNDQVAKSLPPDSSCSSCYTKCQRESQARADACQTLRNRVSAYLNKRGCPSDVIPRINPYPVPGCSTR